MISPVSGPVVGIHMACVPPTESDGCEVWGHRKLLIATAASREALAKCQQPIFRYISGVRILNAVSNAAKSIDTAFKILTPEMYLMCLPNQWLLRAATGWNALATVPPASLYRQMALDACAWASSMSRAIRGT